MTAMPKCKEGTNWKHKEREEFGASITNFFITMPFTLATM